MRVGSRTSKEKVLNGIGRVRAGWAIGAVTETKAIEMGKETAVANA